MPYADPKKISEYGKKWAKQNPDRMKLHQRTYNLSGGKFESHLRRTYGLSIDQWDDLMLLQGGCCAICQSEFGKKVCVDHCHSTNQIRGLLCPRCNQWMAARDSFQWVEKASVYQSNIVFNGVVPMNWTYGS